MASQLVRLFAWLIIASLVGSALPTTSSAAPPPVDARPVIDQTTEPEVDPPLTPPPFVDPHLPSLVVHITVGTNQVGVGDTTTVTVTVTNQAPDPADALAISLPLPTGVVVAPRKADAVTTTNTAVNTILVGGKPGLQWSIGRLEANQKVSVTAQLTLATPG